MKDDSKEIFKKYYSTDKKNILKITLKDNTVLEGVFISYFHGDEDFGEPYIVKWHFLDKDDVEKHDHLISLDGSEDYGKIIFQKDIKRVEFTTK